MYNNPDPINIKDALRGRRAMNILLILRDLFVNKKENVANVNIENKISSQRKSRICLLNPSYPFIKPKKPKKIRMESNDTKKLFNDNKCLCENIFFMFIAEEVMK